MRLLIELAVDKERGWTVADTTDQAMAWEHRFVNIAPAAADAYAQEYGAELLQRTARARQHSSGILRQLDSNKPLDQAVQEFQAKYGSEFVRDAKRLTEWAGVMQIHDSEDVYLLACCGVLASDAGKSFAGDDPLENTELMWQIQLVADGILSWSKEPAVVRSDAGDTPAPLAQL